MKGKVLIVTAFVIVFAAVAAAAVNVKNPRDVSFAGVPEGAEDKGYEESEPLSEIAFCYVYDRMADPRKQSSDHSCVALVDMQGNAYWGTPDDAALYCHNVEQLCEDYHSGKLLTQMTHLEYADAKSVQKYCTALQEVAENPEFVRYTQPIDLQDEMTPRIYESESYYGFYTDDNGNRSPFLFFVSDMGRECLCTDQRVYEIVDWFKAVMGKETAKRNIPERKVCQFPVLETADMPEILFYCAEADVAYISQGSYRKQGRFVYLIDRCGNLYEGYDTEFKNGGFQERYASFLSGERSDQWRLIGTVDMQELERNYGLLQKAAEKELLSSRHLEKMPFLNDGDKRWFGVYCDEEGKMRSVLMQCEYYDPYIYERKEEHDFSFKDTEVNVIVEWMEERYRAVLY